MKNPESDYVASDDAGEMQSASRLTACTDLSAASNSAMALAMKDSCSFDLQRLGLPDGNNVMQAGMQQFAGKEGTGRQTYGQKGKEEVAANDAGTSKERDKPKDRASESEKSQPKDKAPDGKEIDRMIKNLGDYSFLVREKASKDLEKVGQAAIAKLVEAANTSTDPEVVKRAERLLDTQIKDLLDRTGDVGGNLERLGHIFTMLPGGPVRGPVNDQTMKMLADPKSFNPTYTPDDKKTLEQLMKWKRLPDYSKEKLELGQDCLKNPIDAGKAMIGLNLIQSQVTDKGMEDLVRGMPNLKTLFISCTHLTDKGLDKLGALKNLERVMFYNEFSDQAIIKFVKQSKNLKELCILDPKTFDRLGDKLKEINPGLKVQSQGMAITDDADSPVRQLRAGR